MISVKIEGGLGNQMFQYAAGYSLAKYLNVELAVDLSSFENKKIHNGYELDRVFKIDVKSTKISQSIIGQSSFGRKIIRLLAGFNINFPGANVYELEDHLYNKFFEIGNNSNLIGYWQSSKYFDKNCEDIFKIFEFQDVDLSNKILAQEMANENSVSIHVRRGDYASNKNALMYHGVLDLDYYKKSISYLKSKHKNLKYYIFSDSKEWVLQNLPQDDDVTIVNLNAGKNSYMDMYLMTACKHNIIANSTFSWWGAWLNKYPEKEVVCPRNWNLKANNLDKIYPLNWIKI
jgi:hypothetical protein